MSEPGEGDSGRGGADRGFAAAFAGLAGAEGGQPPALAARALASRVMALMREGEPHLAWLVAERLCRTAAPPSADALALRAAAAQAAGDAEAAARDLAAAIAIQPRHGAANLAIMRFLEPEEQRRAALRLLRPEAPEAHLAAIARTLGGAPAAAFASDAEAILGIAVWRQGAPPRLAARFDDASPPVEFQWERREPRADPQYWVATAGIPWPEGALAARIEGEALTASDAVFRKGAAPLAPSENAVPAAAPDRPRAVAVIVPIHGDAEATRACLAWLAAVDPNGPPIRIVAVDDRTPEPGLAALLDALAAEGAVTLIRNAENLGFAASVNKALSTLAEDEDALLLNADAYLPPTALDRLQRAAYAAPDIGTVTPLSNNGEYTSAPLRFRENPLPDAAGILAADDAAARANAGVCVDLPNGIGFCLYIRRDALTAAGPLSLAFGRGYYEDVEFCLRLASLGYRNVCAADVYVGHSGGASFGAQKRLLVMDNQALVHARYPDYKRVSADFVRADPLGEAASQFEAVRLARGRPFDLVAVPAGSRARIGAFADAEGEAGTQALVIASGDEIAIRFLAGGQESCLALRYRDGDGADAIAADLSMLPVRGLTLIDAHRLPTAFVEGAERSGLDPALGFASPGAHCARVGLGDRHGAGPACCNGRCPFAAEESVRLLGARAIQRIAGAKGGVTASTKALAALMRHLSPGLAIEPAPALPGSDRMPNLHGARIQSGRRRLAVVGDADPLLLQAVAATALKAAPDLEIVVLGAMAEDLRLMQDPRVFVMGATTMPEAFALLPRLAAERSLSLFMADRIGIEGDAEAEAIAAAGWPVARFDWSVRASVRRSPDLQLRPDDSNGGVARSLAGWLAAGGGAEPVDREQLARIEAQLR